MEKDSSKKTQAIPKADARSKTTAKRLKDSEVKYRRLFEAAQDGILILNGDTGLIIDANPFVTDLMGYTRESLLGKHLWEIGAFKNIDASKIAYAELQKKNFIRYNNLPLETKNKRLIDVEFVSNAYQVDGLRIIQCNIRDVTEHMKLDELLRHKGEDSEEKHRILFETMAEGVVCQDINGKIIEANPAAEQILGLTIDQMIGRTAFDPRWRSIHEDGTEFPGKTHPVMVALQTGKPVTNAIMGIFHPIEERYCWILVNAIPQFKRGEDRPYQAYTTFTDITNLKHSEIALRQSEQNFRNSIDDSPLGILILTSDTSDPTFLYANKAHLDLYGCSSLQEFQTIAAEQRFTPQSYIAYKKRKRQRLKGESLPESYEASIVRKDGAVRYLQMFLKPVLWESKIQNQLIHVDITERKLAEEALERSYQNLQKAIDRTISAIALISETRDPYTAGHQQRVAKLAFAIAEEMGLSKEKMEGIGVAGLLHDIGKINIPAEILSKPGKLGEIEMSLIKTHPQVGCDILNTLELPWEICPMVLQHHERIDGSGYPSGISGEDIILEARILAVADVVEAISSHRPYRPALGIDKALEEISENKGKLYDPDVVDACIKLFNEKSFKLN